MNTVSLNVSRHGLLQVIKKSPALAEQAINQIFRRATQEGTREAKREAPKADSTLTNSIAPKQLSYTHHQIITGPHYSRYVEEGTGPGGWVPDKTMEDWLKVKGIRPRDPDMSMEQLVYLIQTHIFYTGTPSQPYLKPAAALIRKRLPAIAPPVLERVFNKGFKA
ncbi:hypothetical protein [uncultured Alteromonas sp.]|jgi:hypothetical protein|uniref:hypothetical protein n=1 Tax=uncultured Alteromonas sp. TaxID=179113 RepID=UPI0025EA7DE5|nr:hypothetical protein [uncultured Alteromonas sp.]